MRLGRAGIVLGLEVSRLARNNADWHRLLEICALSDTLILDEDGLYDPSHFNDRLLLGLKGTMSEAELHVLRARLEGGIQSKARRGELKMRLPTGLVYDEQDRVVLDPDRQVQQSFFTFFETFDRTGTACATVRYFRRQGLLMPRRLRRGPKKGELVWMPLRHSRTLEILHNPRYAGVFFRGRTRTRKDAQGRRHTRLLPQEQWDVQLASLTSDEVLEIHALPVAAVDALGRLYGPGGFNLGWNLGRAAGAGIEDHIHLHVVPRWSGDTNFMPVLADVKVVPEHLLVTRDRLREAWPSERPRSERATRAKASLPSRRG